MITVTFHDFPGLKNPLLKDDAAISGCPFMDLNLNRTRMKKN